MAGIMKLAVSLCSPVEHTYMASHPSITTAFVGTICCREFCGMYSFYVTGAMSHISYPLYKQEFRINKLLVKVNALAYQTAGLPDVMT